MVFESSVAKFASTVKEDWPGGCVSSLAFVEPSLNSALSPFFKNADSRHGLVLGYGATNLQEIEEGLRRLASILQKRGPLIVHQDNTVFTLIYFQTTSARAAFDGAF